MSAFSDQLLRLREEGNLRSLPEIVHEGKHVLKDGRRMLNLSSNDYLGLASEPEMMRRFMSDAAESCRNGVPEDLLLSSSSSRLLTGTFGVHSLVEQALCRLSGREAALVFSSGYHMNEGILPAIADSSSVILADKLVHASIIDGMRLSQAKSVRYRHQDMSQLDALAAKYSKECERTIIVTESIFSMDGDVSDLRALVEIKKRYPGVMLYVDEAHAVGVCGKAGMGVAEEQCVMNDIDFLCGTFGKALASAGAYLLCDKEIREFLVNRMRPLIFTTALPPLNMLWTLKVLESLADMREHRERLAGNAAKIRSAVRVCGLECPSESHIVPIMAGESHRAIALAEKMQKAGFYLLPVRPPTVPEGTSRLRVSLTAAVTGEETDRFIATLKELL